MIPKMKINESQRQIFLVNENNQNLKKIFVSQQSFVNLKLRLILIVNENDAHSRKFTG